MYQRDWNCTYGIACPSASYPGCLTCTMFKFKMETNCSKILDSSTRCQPDNDAHLTYLETRLAAVEGALAHNQRKLYDHLKATTKRQKQVGAY